jgi:hypothetical protein
MSSSNTTIPGLLLPTQQGMVAGNPRDSAIAEGMASEQKLQALQKIGGGKMKKKWGGAGNIIVPQFTMQYTPQGGQGQTPNSIITQSAIVGTQGAANAVYDNFALQKGGRLQCGSYTGGKKTKSKRVNKKKGTRRTTKKHGYKKTRKTRKTRK